MDTAIDILTFRPRFRKINIATSQGKVTMAYTPVSFEKDKYLVSFSFCSPKDIYNKAMGQFIALQRLLSSPKFNADGSIKKVSAYLVEKEKEVPMLKTVGNLICEIAQKRKIRWAESIIPDDFR